MNDLEYGDILLWLLRHRGDRDMMERLVRAVNAKPIPTDLVDDWVYWEAAMEAENGRVD